MYSCEHRFDRLNDAATMKDETPNTVSNTIFVFPYPQRFKNINSSFLFINFFIIETLSKNQDIKPYLTL